ncbi:MAG TPA: hypothetical protein VE057_24615 [Archangium sp.]|nr:hypothetical protein [Archangium sp.]
MTTRHAPRALLTGLLLASSVSAAASSPSFHEQVDAYARGLSFSVDWVSSAQLDEDPELEHLARLCIPSEENSSVLYVLEQAPGVLWTVSPDSERRPCPSSPPEKHPLPTRLGLSMDDYRTWSSATVAFREERPVVLESSEGSALILGESHGGASEKEDWESLTFGSTSEYTETTESGDTHHQKTSFTGALLPVLASPGMAATLPPTHNQVTHGAKHWRNAKDASFRVAALAQGPDAVRLRIQVREDVTVPATSGMSDRDLLGTDHLELWWAARDGQGVSTRQLAVARTGEGTLLARWLHPAGLTEPLPTVALDGDTFVVDLPLSSLGVTRPEESWQAPFTVVFSDSDVPGAGQQTLVATSTLRWNEPETFGRLVSFPGHTRYPPVEQSRWERANIDPPRRLELTDAGPPVIPEQAPSPAQPASPTAQEFPTPPEQPRWVQKTGQFLPYLLMGALFVALVAATSRHDTSRVLLVLGGLIASLAFSIPFSLSFYKPPDALSGIVIIIPLFALTNLVLLPVSGVLTWKLSRTPGRNRVWFASALASSYLLSVSAMLNR